MIDRLPEMQLAALVGLLETMVDPAQLRRPASVGSLQANRESPLKNSGSSLPSRCNNVLQAVEEFEPPTDRDLIERFRAGDRDAFAALYRAHHPAVFRFALYMTGDRARAGEVTQDVFVWLIRHPDSFDAGRGALAAFLTGVARQFVRRRKQEDCRWLPLDESAASRLHLINRPAVPREISAAEDAADLWKAIASLPEPYREVVVLCDMEEMSNEKAAAALGCAVGTVWSRLNRAHALLFRKLKGKETQRCSV